MTHTSDFLTFLYAHYIKPYLDTRPRDDGDTFRASLCEGNQTEETRKDVEAVVAVVVTSSGSLASA